ncbi:Uncharacterised protein [Morganella morganii]|nr:Uncharacterised protein [Morganella morganii]
MFLTATAVISSLFALGKIADFAYFVRMFAKLAGQKKADKSESTCQPFIYLNFLTQVTISYAFLLTTSMPKAGFTKASERTSSIVLTG